MMEPIIIRRATIGDLPTILGHRRAMFCEMGYTDPAKLDAMQAAAELYYSKGLGDGSYRGWLAVEPGGHIVAGGGIGLIAWPPHPKNPQARRPTVFNVYTEPAYRRRGVARQLMQTMIDWCRKHGYGIVHLHASDQGRPLYEAMGFKPTSEMHLSIEQGKA